MTVKYIAMSSEVVITDANNQIEVTAGGSTETLTIENGSWYVTGASSSNLAQKVRAAFQTHTNISTCTVSQQFFINADVSQPTNLVTFNFGGAACSFTVGAGATTFDWLLLGFSASTSSSTFHINDSEIKGLWIGDQPPEGETKGGFDTETVQESALDGTVYTFNRGSTEQSHSFEFNFIAPWKTLEQERDGTLVGGVYAPFQNFQSLVSDGRGVRVHKVGLQPGGSAGELNTSDMLSNVGPVPRLNGTDWVFGVETCSSFLPSRFSPGLEVYSFPVSLRKKV